VFVLTVVLTGSACEPKWATFTSDQDKFSAEFPGPVEVSTKSDETGLGAMHSRAYRVTHDWGDYGVFVADWGMLPDINRFDPEALAVESFKNELLGDLGVRNPEVTDHTLVKAWGQPVSQLEIKHDKGVVAIRTFTLDRVVYVVGLEIADHKKFPQLRDRFFTSFTPN